MRNLVVLLWVWPLFSCGDVRLRELPPIPETAEVVLQPASLRLQAGQTRQLVAQANDAEHKPIGGAAFQFSSTSPGLIKVNPDGLVTALGPVGSAQISVASGSATASIQVNVVAGLPEFIEATSPREITGRVGTIHPAPVEVLVTDANRNPVRGALIEFHLTASGGAIEPTRTVTDADGMARAMWTLGPRAGRQIVTMQLDGIPESGISITAVAESGHPATVRPLTAMSQAAAGGSFELRVQALDQHGNPVGEQDLSWTASDGDLEPRQPKTDITGIASALWKPRRAGEQQVTAAIANAPDITATFRIQIQPGPAAALLESRQREDVATKSPAVGVRTVLVHDANDNPVPGVQVSFAVVAGGGRLEPVSSTTNERGEAATTWTLGPDESQAMEASVDGLPTRVRFEEALPPTPKVQPPSRKKR